MFYLFYLNLLFYFVLILFSPVYIYLFIFCFSYVLMSRVKHFELRLVDHVERCCTKKFASPCLWVILAMGGEVHIQRKGLPQRQWIWYLSAN